MAYEGETPAPAQLTTPPEAVVETTLGKVRGARRRDIYQFKGAPYAADPVGEGRFQPPRPREPWSGVRATLTYGPVCPQVVDGAGRRNSEVKFLFDWDDGFQGEDCLALNVWTPGVGAGARPVMVWLHGGGYEFGSAQELPSYDGENLARRGDVVVVSLNHRLGAFGYLNLSGLGGAFEGAVNVGQLDIVAALQWVLDNIAAFGGDPGAVTLFGQSGGAGKINALMAMPAAKGLFHKAILQSGSQLGVASPERSGELARGVLRELEIDPARAESLLEVPLGRLLQAAQAADRALPRTPGGPPWETMGWQPTVDGQVIPAQTWTPHAPAQSADIPILVGSTLYERPPSLGNPAGEAMSEESMLKRLGFAHGEHAASVAATFRTTRSGVTPAEIVALANSHGFGRIPCVSQARRKAAQNAAPAWLYWFSWATPVLDGRPRSFHCSELAFAFDNIDRCLNATGGGEGARRLAGRMADAWISFARTGDPNHADLPPWAPVGAGGLPTMMFDDVCEVLDDPDRDERAALTGR